MASLNRGTARDEKLQQTMNLTMKRLNTYQQVSEKLLVLPVLLETYGTLLFVISIYSLCDPVWRPKKTLRRVRSKLLSSLECYFVFFNFIFKSFDLNKSCLTG